MAQGPGVLDHPFIGQGGQTPVSGAAARDLLRLGLSVYFSDIRGTVAESKGFLSAIEQQLGVPSCSTVGVFVNAPGSGLPLHHDSHDQLFFQLIGEKRFEMLRERTVSHPTIPHSPTTRPHPQFGVVYRRHSPGVTELEAKGLESLSLSPGSCFFMPAGTWHRTTEQKEPCLSLVIAVRPPSQLDLLLNSLRSSLGQVPRFRAPAYGHLGASAEPSPEQEGDWNALLSEASRALKLQSWQATRRAWLASTVLEGSTLAYPHHARFEHYIRVPGTRVSLEDRGDGVTVCRARPTTGEADAVLQFSSAALPLAEWLLASSAGFSVDDCAARFGEFDEVDLRSMLDIWASVGILRPLPGPPWPAD